MTHKKGIAHLFVIVLILVLLVVGTILVAKFVFKKKISLGAKKPNVSLKTEYKNPFDKKTQYVNPFDDSKNPFVNLAKK